jgi:hypothetical protein
MASCGSKGFYLTRIRIPECSCMDTILARPFGAPTGDVNGAVENLLHYLRMRRKHDQARSIAWVAGCLSGILVKKAIINAYVSRDYYKTHP